MSTLTLEPKLRMTDTDDDTFVFIPEFSLPSPGAEQDAEDERVRYDAQILAGLVSP